MFVMKINFLLCTQLARRVKYEYLGTQIEVSLQHQTCPQLLDSASSLLLFPQQRPKPRLEPREEMPYFVASFSSAVAQFFLPTRPYLGKSSTKCLVSRKLREKKTLMSLLQPPTIINYYRIIVTVSQTMCWRILRMWKSGLISTKLLQQF